MGSNYFGEPSLGNGRSGSSRKGKKSNQDKPKQPQRGLGVAQLEKIRLRNQMGCCYLPSRHSTSQTNVNQEEDVRVEMAYASSASSTSYSSPSSFGFHPNIMMGLGDRETTDIRYGDSQSSGSTARWNPNNSFIQAQHAAQSTITRHFLRLPTEDSMQKKRRHDRCDSMGSSSQNSDSSDTQELDLDLKLSL
ncbi:protein SPEAR1-like [Magnolia sinica]|uniref:protein SPEAR1-like n=1 Tax=Magnolia sinica TaxID=86752 RepID=UPI002657C7F1|nr:protein SPEAR1-like [Magnolia sinica]